MKEQNHIWEADIRKKIVAHEFDYDSIAWDEMEQLLDEGAMPPADINMGPASDSGIGGFSKGIYFSIIFLGAIALWWFNRPQPVISSSIKSMSMEMQSSSIDVEEGSSQQPISSKTDIPEDRLKKIIKTLNEEAPNKMNELSSELANSPSEMIQIEDVNTEVKNERPQERITNEPQQRKQTPSLDLLPLIKYKLQYNTPKTSIKLEVKPSNKIRLRDNNKLYPDVIEKY